MSEKLDVPISGVRLIHEIATGRTSKPIKIGFKPVSAFAANQADSSVYSIRSVEGYEKLTTLRPYAKQGTSRNRSIFSLLGRIIVPHG
jgi:hypothetical protein